MAHTCVYCTLRTYAHTVHTTHAAAKASVSFQLSTTAHTFTCQGSLIMIRNSFPSPSRPGKRSGRSFPGKVSREPLANPYVNSLQTQAALCERLFDCYRPAICQGEGGVCARKSLCNSQQQQKRHTKAWEGTTTNTGDNTFLVNCRLGRASTVFFMEVTPRCATEAFDYRFGSLAGVATPLRAYRDRHTRVCVCIVLRTNTISCPESARENRRGKRENQQNGRSAYVKVSEFFRPNVFVGHIRRVLISLCLSWMEARATEMIAIWRLDHAAHTRGRRRNIWLEIDVGRTREASFNFLAQIFVVVLPFATWCVTFIGIGVGGGRK